MSGGCLDRQLTPLNPCLVSGVSRQVEVANIDKVDVLFMVDNSGSMKDKQRSLREQFPKLIQTLTTGVRVPGQPAEFPPVKDLHLGVVTSDMGVAGVTGLSGCDPNGGQDGRLQHTPVGERCDPSYPTFLTYTAATPTTPANTTPDKLSADFGCIADVGTAGCGFEQQLEAPLKALWPRVYADAMGNVVTPNPVTFLATTAEGTFGHGDQPALAGGNLGFLRPDSLLAIVVVTDEEDCSVRNTDIFKLPGQLDANSPLRNEDINLRCFYNKEAQFDVRERYLQSFRKLRPGKEDLVVFAGIVGVPVDLVDAAARADVDFHDDAARDAYYTNILADNRMVEQVDPSTQPGSGKGNLMPSCTGTDSTGALTLAYPPRRIVQLAQMFGENGIVQSICQSDFGPAMDAIIDVIVNNFDAVCLPRPLVRKANGLVPCNVVWELPKPGDVTSPAPTDCTQASYLSAVQPGRAAMNPRGGNNCQVQQLAVPSSDIPSGSGWYYDDFAPDLKQACLDSQLQRVAFSTDAKPPSGVIVKLECLNETQVLASTRTDLAISVTQPGIGTPCGMDVSGALSFGDAACTVTLASGQQEHSLFCQPDQNVCVQSCRSDNDCPPAWVCDARPATLTAAAGKGAYCVNPTCGAD